MATPLYIFTGHLSSGKTRFLSEFLAAQRPAPRLYISFERGRSRLPQLPGLEQMHFSARELRQDPERLLWPLRAKLSREHYSAVYIEWNGSFSYGLFSRLFLENEAVAADPTYQAWPAMGDLFSLKALTVVADANLPRTVPSGDSLLAEYLFNADYVLLPPGLEPGDKAFQSFLDEQNSGAKTFAREDGIGLYRAFKQGKLSPFLPLVVPLGLLIVLRLIFGLQTELDYFFSDWSTRVIGIFLQALPYLLLGVALSTAIEVFVPDDWMRRHFPRNLLGGFAFALVAAFCLPVCDCASVPVFRGMVRKGVPLPSALLFMLASPLINPVVLLSTYAAFPDYPYMLLWRSGFGLLLALLTVLSFALVPEKTTFVRGGIGSACRCGCFINPRGRGLAAKLSVYAQHLRGELLQVGSYLLIGILVSALFQSFFARLNLQQLPFALALPVMLGLAFILSLCSSSDAILARSYTGAFGFFPVLGFLIFGPMLDFKNMMMLNGTSRRFRLRLALTLTLLAVILVTVAYLVLPAPALGFFLV